MLGRKLFSSSLVLGLVATISFPAHADLLKNFKTDGSIETRSFGIDNETDADGTADDYRSETRTRVMVGGSFDILDDVHARILLTKNNRLYGQNNENANSVQTALSLDNAYVKIDKVFGHVDLTMGTQFYGDPDSFGIYFGPNNDDILSINTVDVFRADADLMGWAKFEGIAGKIQETTPTSTNGPATPTNTNNDTDIWGVRLMNDKLIPKGGISLGYWTRTNKGAGTLGNNTVNLLELCAKGDALILPGLGYHADYLQNFGRNNTTSGVGGNTANNGNAYFLGVNYGHDMNAMPLRAHVEYGRGSNDFSPISAGHRFGIIWGEHSTVGPSTSVGGAGLTNLKVFDGGLGVNPIAKLGVDLNAYRFMFDQNNATAGGSSAGTEYDLILTWKHSDNVSLEANAASFQVGQALANVGSPTSPITRLGADVKIKF
jgi:hypothetical protein